LNIPPGLEIHKICLTVYQDTIKLPVATGILLSR
jgi:hypothetical protein